MSLVVRKGGSDWRRELRAKMGDFYLTARSYTDTGPTQVVLLRGKKENFF